MASLHSMSFIDQKFFDSRESHTLAEGIMWQLLIRLTIDLSVGDLPNTEIRQIRALSYGQPLTEPEIERLTEAGGKVYVYRVVLPLEAGPFNLNAILAHLCDELETMTFVAYLLTRTESGFGYSAPVTSFLELDRLSALIPN